jgi:hypothetical protein
VTAQASELRECEIGITPFDCPRDNFVLEDVNLKGSVALPKQEQASNSRADDQDQQNSLGKPNPR